MTKKSDSTQSVHPKKLNPGESYSPECWHFEKRYFEIRSNKFGYWATMYVTHQPSKDKENWYPVIINDKIAKSFPHLVRKIEATIEKYESKAS